GRRRGRGLPLVQRPDRSILEGCGVAHPHALKEILTSTLASLRSACSPNLPQPSRPPGHAQIAALSASEQRGIGLAEPGSGTAARSDVLTSVPTTACGCESGSRSVARHAVVSRRSQCDELREEDNRKYSRYGHPIDIFPRCENCPDVRAGKERARLRNKQP